LPSRSPRPRRLGGSKNARITAASDGANQNPKRFANWELLSIELVMSE
jgi:hypothetical protein